MREISLRLKYYGLIIIITLAKCLGLRRMPEISLSLKRYRLTITIMLAKVSRTELRRMREISLLLFHMVACTSNFDLLTH